MTSRWWRICLTMNWASAAATYNLLCGFLPLLLCWCSATRAQEQVSVNYLTSLHISGPEGWAAASYPPAPPLLAEDGELYFLDRNSLLTMPAVPAHYNRIAYLHTEIGVSRLPGALVQSPLTGHFYGSSFSGNSVDDVALNRDGAVFRAEFDGTFPEVFASSDDTDLYHPNGVVVLDSEDQLYGLDWGPELNGRIFKVDTAGNFSVVHRFSAPPEGHYQYPNGMILASDGWLYGVTAYARGLPYADDTPSSPETLTGSLYRVNPNAPESFEILHEFILAEGEIPWIRKQTSTTTGSLQGPVRENALLVHLVEAEDGYLYGSTSIGICYSRADPSSSTWRRSPLCGGDYSPTHNFGAQRGTSAYWSEYPHYDGPNIHGSLYRIKRDGSDFTLLHTFSGEDGSQPRGPLAIANDGHLYGTTMSGGANAHTLERLEPGESFGDLYEATYDGTLYRLKLKDIEVQEGQVIASGFEHLHSFKGGIDADLDGKVPVGVNLGSDGKLYGACLFGGRGYSNTSGKAFLNDDKGTIFSVTIAEQEEELASVTVTVNPPSLSIGETAELTWTTHNAVACVASGGAGEEAWSGEQAAAGSIDISPQPGTYFYTLTCENASSGNLVGELVTLRVDAEARVEDGNTVRYGNGAGAISLAYLALLAVLLCLRRAFRG